MTGAAEAILAIDAVGKKVSKYITPFIEACVIKHLTILQAALAQW